MNEPEYLMGIHNFCNRTEDEISISRGDYIEVIEDDSTFKDSWYVGRNLRTNKTGLFPKIFTTAVARLPDEVRERVEFLGGQPQEQLSQPVSELQSEETPELYPPQPLGQASQTNSATQSPQPSNDDSWGSYSYLYHGTTGDTLEPPAEINTSMTFDLEQNNDSNNSINNELDAAISEMTQPIKPDVEQPQHYISHVPPANGSSSVMNSPKIPTSVNTWSPQDVESFFHANGFVEEAPLFARHRVSGPILLELNRDTLKEIEIDSFGPRYEIYKLIQRLRASCGLSSELMSMPSSPVSAGPNSINDMLSSANSVTSNSVQSSFRSQNKPDIFDRKVVHAPVPAADAQAQTSQAPITPVSDDQFSPAVTIPKASNGKDYSPKYNGTAMMTQDNGSSPSLYMPGQFSNKPSVHSPLSSPNSNTGVFPTAPNTIQRVSSKTSSLSANQSHSRSSSKVANKLSQMDIRENYGTPLQQLHSPPTTNSGSNGFAEEPSGSEKSPSERRSFHDRIFSSASSGTNKIMHRRSGSHNSGFNFGSGNHNRYGSVDSNKSKNRLSWASLTHGRSQSNHSVDNLANGHRRNASSQSTGSNRDENVRKSRSFGILPNNNDEAKENMIAEEINAKEMAARSNKVKPQEGTLRSIIRPSAQKQKTSAFQEGIKEVTAADAAKTAEKSGWMAKRSGSGFGGWSKRFFTLHGTRLSYFSTFKDKKERGLIDITGHRVQRVKDTELLVNLSAAGLGAGRHCFKLIPPGPGYKKGVAFTAPKVHYFSVENEEELREWQSALMSATIERDDTIPAISTCQTPTMSLPRAQELMAERLATKGDIGSLTK